MNNGNIKAANHRSRTYWLLGMGLALLYMPLRGVSWHGSLWLHTSMKATATLLALSVGLFALYRFHKIDANILALVAGAGFIGTGLLNGYYFAVTSPWLIDQFPTSLSYLIPWSRLASQLLLALMLFLAWAAWRREQAMGPENGMSPALVYTGTLSLTIIVGFFISLAPLTLGYYQEQFSYRPQELIPGFIFLLALVGFIRKNGWQDDPFEHWLVVCIIVNLVAQVVFMPFSNSLFDIEFDTAHALQSISYICALTGLVKAVRSQPEKLSLINKQAQFKLSDLKPSVIGLRLQMLLTFLVIFALALSFISFAITSSRLITKEKMATLDAVATSLKNSLQQDFQSLRSETQLIGIELKQLLADSQKPVISERERGKYKKAMARIIEEVLLTTPSFRHIGLYDINGNVVIQAGNEHEVSISLNNTIAEKTAIISGFSTDTSRPMTEVTAPLTYQGKPIGVIRVLNDMHAILKLVNSIHALGDTDEAVIATYDSEGTIIFLNLLIEDSAPENRQPFTRKSEYLPMKKALDGIEGVYESNVLDYTGKPVLAALRYLPDVRIGIVVKISKAEVYKIITNSIMYNMILGIIILAMVLLISWISAHLFIAPLGKITTFAKRFGAGDSEADLNIQSRDEFGLLARTLSDASRQISEWGAFLSASEAKQRAVLENMIDAVCIIDQKGSIQYSNNACQSLFGYSSQVLHGKNVKILMPEPYRSKHDGYLKKYVDTGHSNIIGIDQKVTGKHKSGKEFPIRLAVSRIDVRDQLLFAGIMHDLSEKNAYEKALKEKSEALQEANIELEQFAYIASHDLKSPLRAVENLVSWIIEDVEGVELPSDAVKNLNRLQERAQVMERMIQELLEYSRAGRSDYPVDTIDTQKLMDKIIQQLSPSAGFAIVFKEILPTVIAPLPALELALRNLISNAINHHDREQGKIEVTINQDEGAYILGVCDDGPGIEPQYQDKIFQIFQTLAPKNNTNNTGMGLALVKRTVERYGGSLQVHSEAGKRGACFEIKWPVGNLIEKQQDEQ